MEFDEIKRVWEEAFKESSLDPILVLIHAKGQKRIKIVSKTYVDIVYPPVNKPLEPGKYVTIGVTIIPGATITYYVKCKERGACVVDFWYNIPTK